MYHKFSDIGIVNKTLNYLTINKVYSMYSQCLLQLYNSWMKLLCGVSTIYYYNVQYILYTMHIQTCTIIL